jgi:hypothetical protein
LALADKNLQQKWIRETYWGYTRRQGTHNRFFSNTDELIYSIKAVFRKIKHRPY